MTHKLATEETDRNRIGDTGSSRSSELQPEARDAEVIGEPGRKGLSKLIERSVPDDNEEVERLNKRISMLLRWWKGERTCRSVMTV